MYVYDDQDQDSKNNPGRDATPKEEIKAERRAAYKPREIAEREKLATHQAKGDEHAPDKEASNAELDGREHSPETTPGQSPSDATPTEQDSSFNYHAEKGGRGSRVRSKLKGGKAGKKLAIALGVGGGVSMFAIIMVLIFVIGLFKIPNMAEHILEYQFARASRMLNTEDVELTTEKVAFDSGSVTTQDEIDNIFANDGGSIWSKLKQLKPDNLVNNLESQYDIQYEYRGTGLLNRRTLVGMSIDDGQKIDFSPVTASNFQKMLHPIDTFTGGLNISAQVSTAIDDSMRDDTGIISRTLLENRIRSQLGIGLVAWVLGKYVGKTPQLADDEEEADVYDAVNGVQPGETPPAEPSSVSEIAGAEADADETLAADMKTPADLATITETGTDPNVDAVVQKALSGLSAKSDALTDIKAAINPLSVALPICIIYDGSLQSKTAPATIDEQDNQLQRTFYYVETAADQEKFGDTNAEAVGALNNKLGDITESNPEIRANGGTVDTNLTNISPQESAGGEYSIITALGINNVVLNWILNNTCGALTNPAMIWGGIIGTIAGLIGTGGTEDLAVDGAADAAAQGAKTAVGGVIGRIVEPFVSDASKLEVVGYSDKIAEAFGLTKSGLATTGAIVGLSAIARLITFAKTNLVNNGLSEGADFDNQADCGGNLNANQVDQQEFYGVPLNSTQIAESNIADNQYIADQSKTQSAYQRYLSFSNPNSLMTRFGLDVYGLANGPIVSSLMTDAGKLFNPVEILGNIIGSITGRSAMAAGAADTSDCGIVQWGWTNQELNLIQNNPSYQPAENDLILNNNSITSGSGATNKSEQAAINNDFLPCYNDSMGELLSGSNSPLIQRDDNGNVIGGTCTEANLGPYSISSDGLDQYAVYCKEHGTASTATCPGGSADYQNTQDLIFRWRLEQAYNNGLTTLNGISNPSGGDTLE